MYLQRASTDIQIVLTLHNGMLVKVQQFDCKLAEWLRVVGINLYPV